MASAGRPRTFDKEQALKRAMYVFWEKGYEGTTMSDLINSIGVKGPSVYAAFGNKDAIFMDALTAYKEMIEAGPLNCLRSETYIYSAVSRWLNDNAFLNMNPNNPKGCLIMTSAINATPEHSNVVDMLRLVREEYKFELLTRFEKAKQDGQLKASSNSRELAEFYLMVIQGLALRSKDGAGYEDLKSIVNFALLALKKEMAEPN